MAPKKLEIDEVKVAELASDGASNREIGDILGVDDKTVASRFSALLKKKRAERRLGLRRAQDAAALAGNPALLIWLGKQDLGQRETVGIETTTNDKPRITTPHADARRRGKSGRSL